LLLAALNKRAISNPMPFPAPVIIMFIVKNFIKNTNFDITFAELVKEGFVMILWAVVYV
jgi:hypothetical protein